MAQIKKDRFAKLASTEKCQKLGITKSNIKSKEQRRRLGPVVRQGCTMKKATLQKHARDRKCAGRGYVTKGGKTKPATKKQIVQAIANCPTRTPGQKKNNNVSGLENFQKSVAKVLKDKGVNGGMKGLHQEARELRNKSKRKGSFHFNELHQPSKRELNKMRGKGKNDNLFKVNKSVDLVLDYYGIDGRKALYKMAAPKAKKTAPKAKKTAPKAKKTAPKAKKTAPKAKKTA